MVDTTAIDMLSVVGLDTRLKRRASTNGGEWKGACPVCGGHDRFYVQPYRSGGGRAYCRQCRFAGDVVAYVGWTRGLDFRQACDWLRLELPKRKHARQRVRAHTPVALDSAISPDPQPALAMDWQLAARAFCHECEDILWSKEGRKALEYLLRERHLSKMTIAAAGLGLNPTWYKAQWGVTEVRLPRGIVIPWYFDNFYWNVRIRRPDGDLSLERPNKYISAKGAINSLYRFQTIVPGAPVVIVEGEFDALLLRQIAAAKGLPVSAVATGSTSWSRHLEWIFRLAMASKVCVAFDRETEAKKIDSTERAANWWINRLNPKAQRLLPTQHDITDMVSAGDSVSLWLTGALV